MRAVARTLAQRRQCQLGAEKDAGQVDAAQPMPVGKGRLLDALAEKDPGIVDEDVETAEAIGDEREGRGPVLLAGNVEMGIDGLAAGTLQSAHGRTSALVEN